VRLAVNRRVRGAPPGAHPDRRCILIRAPDLLAPAYNHTRWPPGPPCSAENDMKRLKRVIAMLLVASVASTGFLQTAQATLIGPGRVARAAAGTSDDRARVNEALARADGRDRLQELGVDPQHAAERIAALTDEEVARLAGALDNAPAGGNIVGAIVFIFVLLLVTDILGLTKVFPFTRSVR